MCCLKVKKVVFLVTGAARWEEDMSCRKLDPSELKELIRKMPSKARIKGAGGRVTASYHKHYPTFNVFVFGFLMVLFSFSMRFHLTNLDIFIATCAIFVWIQVLDLGAL